MIRFDPENHLYFDDKGFIVPSVTQILGAVYGTGLENAPTEFVNRAADKGHFHHAEFDTYNKTGQKGTSPEFETWYKHFGKITGESEKIVSAETQYGAFAGTVDLFGNGFIYDWKTCKTATKQQVAKWQKQLSFYCYALRKMGYTVNEPLKIVHVNGGDLEVINVDYLGNNFVEETMKLYADNKQPEKPTYELQTVSKSDLQTLEDTLFQIETLEKVVSNIREKIKDEMERRKILDLQVGRVKMTYVAGTIRQTFDSKKFKQDDPDLYAIYLKNTEVKPSLRITVK